MLSENDSLPSDVLRAFAPGLLDSSLPAPDGVTGPDGGPAPKRFNVYRNNVAVSLVEAVTDSFPATVQLLGEDYFKAVARVFVTNHPPRSPVLLWYGSDFADFLRSFPPLAAYGYLPDVARLEWAWLEAYHAADAVPLSPETLGRMPQNLLAELTLEPHPACRLVRSAWPIFSLLSANRFGGDHPSDLAEAQDCLVSRADLDVEVRLLRPGGAALLEALCEGLPLGQAAQRAAELLPDEEFDLGGCLSDLLAAGAFQDLEGALGPQIEDETNLGIGENNGISD